MNKHDRAILQFDPWGDGKGDDPYRVLRNRMIVGRYSHRCAICFGPIIKGERHRAQTELRQDGTHQVKTFRFCATCCDAMVLSSKDDYEAISQRFVLGQRASKRRRAA